MNEHEAKESLLDSARYILNPPRRKIDHPGYDTELESLTTYRQHAENLALAVKVLDEITTGEKR